MTILARTYPGYEYMYSRRSAHAVPKASAAHIRDELNRISYNLRDGETWHIYTVDGYDADIIRAGGQKFCIRSGKLYATRS